jgi:hypothetical protein
MNFAMSSGRLYYAAYPLHVSDKSPPGLQYIEFKGLLLQKQEVLAWI